MAPEAGPRCPGRRPAGGRHHRPGRAPRRWSAPTVDRRGQRRRRRPGPGPRTPGRAQPGPDALPAPPPGAHRDVGRPSGPAPSGPVSTRRRGWSPTTGPSPPIPSRATGSWPPCSSARRSRGSTPRASCCSRRTVGWPARAGPRSTRDTDPPMGEIYVIGVDPDFHGRGWGRALTQAGLAWLAGRGLTVGMLYVDADNVPARVPVPLDGLHRRPRRPGLPRSRSGRPRPADPVRSAGCPPGGRSSR